MEPLICDFCGSLTRPIQVHGHFQCGRCKRNLAECCSGEQAQQIPEDNHDEPIVSEPTKDLPEEFENDLVSVMDNHYDDNWSYTWDDEKSAPNFCEEGGFYIQLKVWKERDD